MAKLEISGDVMFFNLDADVGRMAPNRIDDVELVRFGYFCQRSRPENQPNLTARQKVSLQAMQPNGPYFADLQEVIDAHQENRGGTQDGKVSTGKSQIAPAGLYDSVHMWIIYALTNNMRLFLPDIFPRIDLHAQSGVEISKRIRQLFAVKG